MFLKKGEYNYPLDQNAKWEFTPLAQTGDNVEAGSWLGEIIENWMPHKIMVPFKMQGSYKVKSVMKKGFYQVNDTIAVISDKDGHEHNITMVQKWPVKLR